MTGREWELWWLDEDDFFKPRAKKPEEPDDTKEVEEHELGNVR